MEQTLDIFRTEAKLPLDYFLDDKEFERRTNCKFKMTKWDKRGVFQAKVQASFSKDPSTKCGCAIMRPDKKFAGFGYNGFAQGVDDSLISNRDIKIPIVLHSEENAVINSNGNLQDCTAYVWSLPCCGHCMSVLAQKKIKRVVCIQTKYREDWKYSFALGMKVASDCGVIYEIYREENIDPLLANATIPEFNDDI
jgi:dCMP deaminase